MSSIDPLIAANHLIPLVLSEVVDRATEHSVKTCHSHESTHANAANQMESEVYVGEFLTPQFCPVGQDREISPLLSIEGVLAAAYSPRDGHCTPESVVLGYATGARRHGAQIFTQTSVDGIDLIGDQIAGVQTSSGNIKTGCVINCAGAWSPQIGELVGLSIPVVPYRREILITEPIADLPARFPMTIDFSTSLYFHREGEGLLMGFSDQEASPGFSLTKDEAFPEKLAHLAFARAPRIMDAGIRTGWAGLYEVTPDHNALLGEWSGASRFLYATGFSGHGFLQGPAIGEILRDLYLGTAPFVDITPLAIERFARGELRPERNIV